MLLAEAASPPLPPEPASELEEKPPHTRLLVGFPRRSGPGEGVTRAPVTGSTEQIRASSALSTGPDVSLESWNPGEFLCLALHCHPQVSHFRQWARVRSSPVGLVFLYLFCFNPPSFPLRDGICPYVLYQNFVGLLNKCSIILRHGLP